MPPAAIAAPAAVGLAAAGGLVWLLSRYIRRRTPAERERRRRIRIHVNGRLTEATIFHADPAFLHYSYQIAGVAYNTSQDIEALQAHLPAQPEQLIGPALAKYDPNNPANSIVICEHWRGCKERKQTQ